MPACERKGVLGVYIGVQYREEYKKYFTKITIYKIHIGSI